MASKEVFPAKATPNSREWRDKRVRESREGPTAKEKNLKASPKGYVARLGGAYLS